MKKLLESYKSIIENNKDRSQSNAELASDMIKFNINFTAKSKLIPFDETEERDYCKKCAKNSITFYSGAFCPVCGFIFPF